MDTLIDLLHDWQFIMMQVARLVFGRVLGKRLKTMPELKHQWHSKLQVIPADLALYIIDTLLKAYTS